MASRSRFIVVGGGPVGLTAAHALSRAGIDFVLLESRSTIVLDAGSNLVLLPIGLRVLGQLGLLPAINKVSSAMSRFKRIDHKGRGIGDTMFFSYFRDNHGAYPRVISRHDLMQVLWEALPAADQSKLLPNKRVTNISAENDGVTVECSDGTSYEGFMIIGADGAHSMVRGHMRDLALKQKDMPPPSKPLVPQINEEQPFLTSYRSLWVRFPTVQGIHAGDAMETHGHDATVQLFAGEQTTVIGVYERLDKPTRESQRYDAADEEAFVARWGHLPITEGGGGATGSGEGGSITIADAFRSRIQSGLVNLEEGVVQHWSWGSRVVLVGDAAHKFTPSTGAGCNNGMVDVVELANQLNRAYHLVCDDAAKSDDKEEVGSDSTKTAQPTPPSAEQIVAAFAGYQMGRYAAVKAGMDGAGQATASATWSDTGHKFVDRYLLSSQRLQKFFSERGAHEMAKMPIFDYIGGEEPFVGKVPWVHPIKPLGVVAK